MKWVVKRIVRSNRKRWSISQVDRRAAGSIPSMNNTDLSVNHAAFGILTTGRFIENDHLRVGNQGNPNAQFPFHSCGRKHQVPFYLCLQLNSPPDKALATVSSLSFSLRSVTIFVISLSMSFDGCPFSCIEKVLQETFLWTSQLTVANNFKCSRTVSWSKRMLYCGHRPRILRTLSIDVATS